MVERHRRFLRNRLGLQLQLNPQQNPIQLGVGNPELALVGLPWPQAGRRYLLDNLRRHADIAGHFLHLRLVQIPDRKEVGTAVAEFREIPTKTLGLVPGAHHDAIFRIRDVIEDRHSRPRPEIPAGDRIGCIGVEPLLQGGDDRADSDNPEFDPERLRPLTRVSEIFAALPVGHCDRQDPSGADRVRAQFRDERRVDPAAQPDDGAISVASYRAGNAGIRNIRFEMLDSRNIVYRGKLFDGAASNLGVPALGYDRVFHEVYRVLKPSGRFVFSEWPTDPNPSFAALRELLEKHGTPSPSTDLAQVREAVRLVRSDPEAKALGDPRAVLEALRVQGFDRRETMKRQFPVRFANPEDLVRFGASYGWYERELREMPADRRKAFDAELAARLGPLTTSAGIEDIWTVNFFIAHPE